MFCSNCGRKLPDGAKFCSFCGERVLEAVKVDDAQAPLDFSDLPGADADNKPAEAPVKTRVTFDWSNVIDEPQRRTVQDIKSPWATTGGIDQKEIYEEMKPSTDRSRTMSFIDVLRAEKEQAEAKEKDSVLSVEETLAADSSGERPIEYTEVLDPGYLDEFVKEETEPAIPELHFAPLYEDLDQPVVTPFDLPEEEEPVAEEPAVEEPVVEEPVFEEPVFEEPVAEEPVLEEPEQDYYFKDPEPVEEPAAHELDYEKFDEADLTQYEEPAETAHYEDEYLSAADEAAVVSDVAEEAIEEPVFEEPVFEEPVFEEPAAEEPAVEEPVFEAPEFEEAVEEEPVAEEPAVEEPVFEAPEFEEAVEEEPVAEEPAVEEPVFEAPEFEEAVEEEPVAEEPVIEELVFEEPVAEEPVVEEVPAEEPEQPKRWFDLPDFLKPREDRAPFEAIDETPVAVVEEEPAVEEPLVEDEYLDVPVIEGEDLVEQEEIALDDYLNEPEFEEVEAELPEIELPVEEELTEEEIAVEEPVFEEPEFEFTEDEAPAEETPVFEEPAFEAPEFEEPVEEAPVIEEPEFEEPIYEAPVEEAVVEEAEAEELEDGLADLYGNTEDEYLDISTERGVVTRSTISFDPDEYDDDDDDEEELPDTQDTFDENEPEDFEAAPAEDEAPAEEEQPEEEVAVDEQELFEEMQEEAPKKTGMTIAAPADKESEIEALKKRLAELMGTDWEEPQKIEKEDKLDLEALVAEEPEQDYYYKDPEPAEEPASHDLDYEGYDEADLTQYEEPAETANYEDEYLKLADVEPAIEEVFAEEPELEIQEEEEPAVEEVAEEVVAEEPVVEEKKTESIDDYLAAILAQEAAPVTRTNGLAADNQSFASVEDAYLDIPEEKPAEVSEPAVEDLLAELPVVEEPELEEPEIEVEEPVVEVEVPAEVPAVEEISIEEPEVEIPEVEVPVAAEAVEDAAEEPVISSLEIEEPAVEAVPEKETDALTIEEIEQELFGETSTEGSAVETKKIDKFYTLYRKNEEFQRLLDEEYNKLKAAGDPAPEQILPDPEPPASAAKNGKQIEDATIYQDFEIPPEALAEAEAKAAAARENAPVKFEKAPAETAAVVAGAAAAGAAAVAAGTADKKAEKKEKDAPEVEYEEVDKGGGFLTALAVIIAILLVILLAIILLLNFAPDSAISIKIDSFIENITSHFTAVEVFGRQILL